MSFSDRLIHALVIERKLSSASEDEYGQPVAAGTAEVDIKGLPQPKSIREIAAISQAGPGIGDWTIFVSPTDLSSADAILHRKDECPVAWPRDLPDLRFEITGIRNAAGLGHHYEIDARAIESASTFEAGS